MVFDFRYDDPGIAKGGTGALKSHGKAVRTCSLSQTVPFILPPGETFDLGVDTRRG